MGSLTDIQKCIHQDALIKGTAKNFLEEKGTSTKVQIQAAGQYLQFDFEKIKQPLFPFFKKSEETKGLNAIADKVLFSEDNKGNLWVIIIELKANKGNPIPQIVATRLFVDYLIDSVNRICNTTYKPKIRGIGYSKGIRPSTKPKTIYTKDIAYVSGDKFILSNYLV
jgi:hypothetical protein